MKHNYLLQAFWLIFISLTSPFTFGQLIGTSAYIIGDNVEIGINDAGHEGAPLLLGSNNRSNQAVTSPVYFGFVANPQLDGWGDYDGDFFTPGSPENGFGIEVAGVNYSNNASGTIEQIPGSITGYTVVGDCIYVDWDGSVGGVDVHLVYRLISTELYYTTEVTLTNTTALPLTDLYYYRNVDPDNNVTIGGGYSTQNTIVAQPTPACEKALVTAEQTTPWDSYLGLGAIGENFRVSYGGFANRDASNIWNGVGGLTGGVGASLFADQAISLAYRVEDLPAGESETFRFTVVLDAAQIDAAISSLYYFEYLGSGGVIDECAPVVDTARTCAGLPITISVDGPSAEDYVWEWAPPIGLSTTDGPTTDASPTTTTEYLVTGTPAAACLATPIEKSIIVVVAPSPIIEIIDPGPQCGEFDLSTLDVNNLEGTPGWELKFYAVAPDSLEQTVGLLPDLLVSEGEPVFMMMFNPTTGCYDVEPVIIDFAGAADAGDDNTAVICNDAGSSIDLNTLLIGAEPGGDWAETSPAPSLSFDAPTGVLTADGLDAGTYTFEYIAYGMLGCEDDTAEMTITVNQYALAGLDATESLCNTAGTTIDLDDLLDGNNGIGLWEETTASGQFDPATGVFDASDLAAGDYTFTYTVNALAPCAPDVADFTITILPNPPVDAGADFAICEGGEATLTGTGAGAGGSYEWTGGITDGVLFYPDVTATYTVTGVDANGCINTDEITITVNPLPLIDAGVDFPICTGDGATLTGIGAGAGGSYEWTGGVEDGIEFFPTLTFNYTVTGTDVNGCSNSDNITVIVNDLPTIDAGDDATICSGDEVTLAGDGAGLSGTYDWSGGVEDGVAFSPLATGEYTVTGTDINGCFNTDIVTVTVNPLPVIEGGENVTICNGAPVTLNASGAGAGGSYEWTGGVTDSTAFFPTTTATYTVTGTDANGCQNTDVVIVTVNPLPAINAGMDAAICIGEAITLTGTGAGAGGTYVWDYGVVNGVSFEPTVTTTYTVVGTDVNGCENSDAVSITVNPLPTITAGDDAAICIGGTITLSGGGAGLGGTYDWSGGVVDGVPFAPTATEFYTVVGTDVNGCSNTDDMLLTVNPLPTVAFEADTLMGCAPFLVNFDPLVPGVTYEWSFGDGMDGTGGGVSHTFNASGLFDVTLTVTSAEGCVNTTTYNEYIDITTTPVADFYFSPDEITKANTAVEFTNTSMDADTYSWKFGDGTEVSTLENPIHVYPLVGDVNYTVELTAMNSHGCKDVAKETIFIKDILLYFIPNTFTPDGDTFNESFKPIFDSGLDIYDYHLLIFNRWGEIMFESYNVDQGWDGTYGGRKIATDGIYVWRIEFGETMSDKTHFVEGHVNLMR